MNERNAQPGVRMGRRGAALIEFVIVMGLLFLLLFGIMEFGFMMSTKLTVDAAAQQGARAVALGKDVTSAVSNGMTGLSGTYPAPVVEYAVNGTTAWSTTPPDPLTSNYQVRVKVTYDYTPITYVGGAFATDGKVPLTGEAVMRYGG